MELENLKDEYRKRGLGICAISRDTPEILNKFATRKNIAVPLLADPGYEVIDAFGIINQTIPKDHRNYGIAHPGQYLVGPDQVVQQKIFLENYWERVTQESVLIQQFGWSPDIPVGRLETNAFTLEYRASQTEVRAGNHITLIFDVHLKDRMHVYAPEVEGGYIPVSWQLKESRYYKGLETRFPEAEIIRMEALDEELASYSGSFRFMQEVVIGTQKNLRVSDQDNAPSIENLVIEGTFGYQACDDKKCYIPDEVKVKFVFDVESHDWQKVN
ncbi:MAG: peroxiredoxin family protein [Candidatus Glassbacteria bacterium]|nr:peroxiredoxin family protein [Candidatus Glassbacteria bacterium]